MQAERWEQATKSVLHEVCRINNAEDDRDHGRNAQEQCIEQLRSTRVASMSLRGGLVQSHSHVSPSIPEFVPDS